MTSDLEQLIEKTRGLSMSNTDKEAQRRSFAYGSAKIENDFVTREMVDRAAEKLELARDK